MQIDDTLLNKLSQLSMLEFNEAEKVMIKNDLEKMIGFIDKLKELDTAGVAPLLHISEATNALRADEPRTMLTQTDALRNAPDHDEKYFKVPKVIRKPA